MHFEPTVWAPRLLSKEQLSCSDLTGLRVRSERCYGDFEAANARFWVLTCRGFCPGGAEVVRRIAPHNFRGSHNQIQVKIKSLDSRGCTNDQQIQASLAISTFIIKDLDAARH